MHEHTNKPRICGEKSGGKNTALLDKGSPPRVRGKATFLELFDPAVWITPAYAGKKSPMKNKGR